MEPMRKRSKKGEEFQLWTKNWDKEAKVCHSNAVKAEEDNINTAETYPTERYIKKETESKVHESEKSENTTSKTLGEVVGKIENKDFSETISNISYKSILADQSNVSDNCNTRRPDNVEEVAGSPAVTDKMFSDQRSSFGTPTAFTSEGTGDTQTVTSTVSHPPFVPVLPKPAELPTNFDLGTGMFATCNGIGGADKGLEGVIGPRMPQQTRMTPEEQSKICENNILEHIVSMQENIDTRLDDIENQLQELEILESNGSQRTPDILRDMPALKKAIHHLIKDLSKVKRMARFH